MRSPNACRLLLSGVAMLLAAVSTAPAAAQKWDPAVFQAPKFEDAPGFNAEGVRAIYYNGLPFRGRPTRVFAWYGLPAPKPGVKAPGIVLVHGGGGTAFDAWVRLWTSRGYAAIAMDNCGQLARGTYGHWERDPQGGPAGWGGFDAIDEPATDQWTYHAVADVILADSLLRSMPEVDADRIGLTGISWGGYLTCITAGVDSRFKFAVPVYGCGFLGDNSVWLGEFKKMGPEKSARWLSQWDPGVYLKEVKIPVLWVDGTNDFAYPMDSLAKSYRLPNAPRTLCTKVRMPHGHGGAGENPEEIHAFADSIVNHGKPLTKVLAQGRDGQAVWATFEAVRTVVRAELNFTRAQGEWQKRLWETIPAAVSADGKNATATLPQDATVHYLNLIDSDGLTVSTEHEEIVQPKPSKANGPG